MNFRKVTFIAALFSVGLGAFTSCKKDNDDSGSQVKEQVVLQGQITSNTTLSADKKYLLKGYVRVMDGATLEIPAGTVIMGEQASKAALIIERGGKIKANGTASNPIVFTSDRPVGARTQGDWSGVIICGKSTVNTSNGTSQYEGGSLGAGVAEYGGTVPNDNSGEFTYVRIEFAGIAIEENKEINGLTLCGVGSGTTIHHVQVSYGGDDAFEFFGGTVNAHHLIAYRSVDDDYDFDQGYSGRLQFGISVKDPVLADGVGTSRGIELENKSGVTGGLYTKPIISNFTFIGPGSAGVQFHGAGIHFGQNSRMILANSIIANARGNAVEFNTEFPAAELLAGRSMFKNNVVFGNTANYGMNGVNTTTFADVAALTTFMNNNANATATNLGGVGFVSTTLASPDLTLSTTSVANNKASFAGTDLATGFEQVTYAGAMGASNWSTGWANWDPKNTVY